MIPFTKLLLEEKQPSFYDQISNYGYKYFNLSNDIFFKLFLSDSKMLANTLNLLNKYIHFLDYIVEEKDITYFNTNNPSTKEKNIIYDLKVAIKDAMFDIEMQNAIPSYDISTRITVYQSKLVAGNYLVGEDYVKKKIISMWLISEASSSLKFNDWYMTFMLTDKKTGITLNEDDYKIILISLKDSIKSDIIEIKEFFQLFYIDDFNFKPTSNIVKEAYQMLNKLNTDENALWLAFKKEDEERIRRADINHAKEESLNKGVVIGTNKGIEIGKEIGIEIGTKNGIEIGTKNNTNQTIKKLLDYGMSTDEISTALGISIEDIIKVKNGQNL